MLHPPFCEVDLDAECVIFSLRYGGLSFGGQLPILEVEPRDIQRVFGQLGRMFNITGVNPILLGHESSPSGQLLFFFFWSFFSTITRYLFFQGYYSGLALREIGPFLRYMESEFNVKVVRRRKIL